MICVRFEVTPPLKVLILLSCSFKNFHNGTLVIPPKSLLK